jgi:methyltransferase (TIGR00027 family)
MNESLPSKTCLYVAAGRALGARDPDPAVRNPDYLAERLLGPFERELVAEQACVQALDLEYSEALKNREAIGSALMMQVRTRFIEERLADAVRSGATQLVILGAGFDTRPYRLADLLRNLRVFEVDRASTQEYKIRRIREAGIEVPANVTFVPVDFRHGELDGALHDAGYDSSQITFFIWEGVTMYLPETAVEETLRWVAAQAPGSEIVFDFVYRGVIDFLTNISLDQMPEQARPGIARVQKLEAGEPWIFGIANGEEAAFLEKVGLALIERMPVGGKESRSRYLTRSDGSFYLPIQTTEQWPQANPGDENVFYCLAVARVRQS